MNGSGVEWLIACGSILSRRNTFKEVFCQCRLCWGRLWKITVCRGVNQCVLFSRIHNFCQTWWFALRRRSTLHPTGKENTVWKDHCRETSIRIWRGNFNVLENLRKIRDHSTDCLNSYLYPHPCHLHYKFKYTHFFQALPCPFAVGEKRATDSSFQRTSVIYAVTVLLSLTTETLLINKSIGSVTINITQDLHSAILSFKSLSASQIQLFRVICVTYYCIFVVEILS